LWLPNENITAGHAAKSLKGFKNREFYEHPELVYLRKTNLFVIYKLLSSLMSSLQLQLFLLSLDANNSDMLYFHNGLLSQQALDLTT
jgi:hypothetical protein